MVAGVVVGVGVGFVAVVVVAAGLAVVLGGEAAFALGMDVVDLAVVRGDAASGVFAVSVAEEDGFAEGSGKEAGALAEVGDAS